MTTESLRITEIFYSLQGESTLVGLPTVFIRLTGCPLRCQYCDTAYAFHGGTQWSIASILQQVAQFASRYVTVTGGEPLAQKSCYPLLRQLCDQGYQVSLETSGALSVAKVDPRVVKVLDIKTPGSGEHHRNCHQNFNDLQPHDQIKFVICDKQDYDWCKAFLADNLSLQAYEVLFSPSYGQLSAHELAEWILADRLAVRLQIQLHKHLWGEKPGC